MKTHKVIDMVKELSKPVKDKCFKFILNVKNSKLDVGMDKVEIIRDLLAKAIKIK